MRFRIGKRGRDQEAVSPAELWLADLLLVLAILFLVFIGIGAQLTSQFRPALVPTATSTPTRTRASTLTSLATDGPSPVSTLSSATTPVHALTDTPSLAPTSTGLASPVSTPPNATTPVLPPTGTPSPAPATTFTSRPSPTSASTPGPSPTSTSAPSPTPLATYTPFPTQTPLPTYTQFPTPTALPTYTPFPPPTALPTYTPFPPPTQAVELDREPITILVVTDADVLLGPGGTGKSDEQDRVRGQIRDGLGSYGLERAAIVFSFGISPQPSEGNRLAAEVNRLLLQEFPDMFGSALARNYHIINSDRARRGQVEVEVYFLTGAP